MNDDELRSNSVLIQTDLKKKLAEMQQLIHRQREMQT